MATLHLQSVRFMLTRWWRQALQALLACSAVGLAAPALALSPTPPPRPPVERLVPPIRIVAEQAREPVRIQAAVVQAEIVGLSVATRVELTLFNPNNAVLSGELQFPLSATQVVTGFALEINGELRDAVPVEKAKGRQVFEDVTRQRVDPALLEATQGNFHKLQVYPLPAAGTRRVVLEIRESIAPGRPPVWRLPLRFGRPVARLDVSVRAAQLPPNALDASLGADRLEARPMDGGSRLDLGRSDYSGANELRVTLPAASNKALTSTEHFRDRRYFVAELPIQEAAWPRQAPRKLGLLWDASGSGAARDHGRELALLEAYFRHLRDVEVQLVLVRHVAEPVQRFRVRGGDWTALRQALEGVAYDGATRMEALVPPSGSDLTLLFTDGIGNWGTGALAFGKTPTFAFTASAGAAVRTLRSPAEVSGGGVADLLSVPTAQALGLLTHERPRLMAVRSNEATDLETASLYPEAGRLAVAGVLNAPKATVRLTLSGPNGRTTTREFDVDTPRVEGGNKMPPVGVAAHRWAEMRLARLEANEALHRREIHDLGIHFRMATRETSLIVLDTLADYVRHDIEPPADLMPAWQRSRQQKSTNDAAERERSLNSVVSRFSKLVTWWETTYPKDSPQPEEGQASVQGSGVARPDAAMDRRRTEEEQRLSPPSRSREVQPPVAMAAPAPAPVMPAPAEARMAAAPAAPAAPTPGSAQAAPNATISLRAWQPNEPYVRRLREAKPEQLYAIYLDEKRGYLNSSAFFLDVADLLSERGEKDLAVRVLSNLAEMDLENRHLLRILAYRLLLIGQVQDALPLLGQVRRLAPDEPQSLRDLALAHAQAGDPQAAVDLLWEVVNRRWDPRFPDVELIALTELNAIAARSAAAGKPLDLTRVDPRLRRALPLDLRVALTWDADNTDIDLWVTDPNGEPCYFGRPLTRQGGHMSRDFTAGFGPEVFSLRDAKPGTYTVQARFYGHRQQVVAPATTLMVKLSTGYGSAGQQDRDLVVRLSGQGDRVTIGTFVVEGKASLQSLDPRSSNPETATN
ncbi:hypothetical protein SAMN05216359_11843 [Roseateles sp. YR242]|uniref:VIT domain-containing protein n=1 Tax=Roseateles sp. YR242 TaxID=1855305 RepID=UPI0008C5B257|nr:VIT domain-containing protein [Roseateles sp. YR242]SEL82231.1 hypothetical protein SAMN05216359_11843 [Roseateles sp. YR242]